jgi:exopolyphosphatase / guanosine-5'-triphosphate,3'-diphosphate pyrophosphatase
MRVAVIDIGTNSTRLLVADAQDGHLTELERRTVITRLGEGVDATGKLADAAIQRVTETLAGYRQAIDDLTSAPRSSVASTSTRRRSPATRRHASPSWAQPSTARPAPRRS